MNSKDLSLNLLWYSITWSSNHLSPRTVLPLFLLRFGLFATSRISAITLVRICRRDLCEMNKGHKLWRNLENLLRHITSHNRYHSISVITRRTRYLVRQPDVRLLSRNNWVTGNLTLIDLVVMATEIFRCNIIRGTFQFTPPNHTIKFSWSCLILTSLQTALYTFHQSLMHKNCSSYFFQK